MAATALNPVSPDEYLARERQARFRSELVCGRVLPVTGAARQHVLIVSAVAHEIHVRLRERTCDVYVGDMRVRIGPSMDYVYPDVVVACHPRFEDEMFDTLLNPCVILEVLSDSTEGYDRGEKFALYRRMESLREYVLLSEKEPLVEHYVREGSVWRYTALDDREGSLALASLGMEIRLRDIYTTERPLRMSG